MPTGSLTTSIFGARDALAGMLATSATVLRFLARSGSPSLLQTPRSSRHERLVTAGVQAFHSSSRQPAAGRRGGVRPSKTAAKEEAKHFQQIARQLSRLTEKQLARLEPLVGEEVVAATALAARISHRNQGRQRQESLVARLLRESLIEEVEVEQLRAAIESVQTGQGVIGNPAAQQQLELWMHALLAGQADAATQVFGLAQARGADLQQLRQLLRQAQQTEPVPAAAAGEEADSSEEGLAAEAAAAAAPAALRPTAKARAARKQLRKLLQPLAEAAVAVDEDEEE
ncbi:hypothetical protein ABPG77_008127 [Micractinium sp. CCAP 211/92]